VIGVLPDDPRFEELVRLFQSYWNDAEPLNDARLKEYTAILQSNKREQDPIDVQNKIRTFGDITPSGIQVGGSKKDERRNLFGRLSPHLSRIPLFVSNR